MLTHRWEPDPDDPKLRSPLAPHEPPLTRRMYKAGWPLVDIVETFDLSARELLDQLMEARTEESRARRRSRDVHEGVTDAAEE